MTQIAGKFCQKCESTKDFSEFYRNASRKDGLQTYCKPCQNSITDRWHGKNKEKSVAYHRANSAAWSRENREKRRANARQWKKRNPDKDLAYVRMRQAKKLMATPGWADPVKMLEFYTEASRLTRETGIEHHVDHIVPLQSKLVCGLHCEFNLQIIPRSENQSKSNRYWPDMP